MDKMLSIFYRVRNAGLMRSIAFLRILPHRLKLKKLITKTANGTTHPARGITIIGPISRAASTSKVLRDLAHSLKNVGIPFQTLDTDPRCQVPKEDIEGIVTPIKEFDVRKFNHVVEILTSVVPEIDGVIKSRIAFWEFADGFREGCADLLKSKHVIAMSDFCVEFYRRWMPPGTKISKLLYPFRFNVDDLPSVAETRAKFGISDKDFMVFFNFDYGSGFVRKNPDGVMRAFVKAFGQSADAKLVFKTMGAKRNLKCVAVLHKLAKEFGIADRFIEIDSYVSGRELYGLTNACDVYISLHRGEGFGLTLAEAMALGKPVICTDWGATTEFCDSNCAMPIPYVMVRPEYVDNPAYRGVSRWADADINEAAVALKKLKDDLSFRRELGEKARLSIMKQFSSINFKKSVEDFLDA